jgi:ABC-2 type transport system ATP-binding protein
MIEVENLAKRYGDKVAVDSLTFSVPAGVVTGFLGPNGAGKSTTLRMIAGLDVPTSGRVRVNGRDYRSSRAPMAELGLLLEAKSVHPGRSARDHLLAIGQTAGIGKVRVNEVIELVGLGDVARKRVGGFSLGMGQRVGIAAALLGRPRTVVMDEPVNGLDPDGVRWIRSLLRTLADEGCTVFYSSHLMSEMAQTAKNLIVIGRGRLIADGTVEQFIAQTTAASVVVRTPEAGRLRGLLDRPGVRIAAEGPDLLRIDGITPEEIGTIAFQARVPVFDLRAERASLEEAFMQATHDSVEYEATGLENL